jgi:hypothetical protein
MPYLLMAFVLLVWLITHKYPVWGLMPLGLLCSNLVYYGSRLVIAQFSYFNLPLFMWQFGLAMLNMVSALRTLNIQMVSQGVDVWLAVAFLLVSVFFIAAWQRRHSFSRAVWIWLAAYGLLSMVLVNLRVQNFVNSLQFGNGGLFPDSATIWGNVLAGEDFLLAKNMVRFWTLYSSGAFLVLIFAGILLARRYGDLAILFPLGYVLGGIVYGVSMEPDDRMLYLVVGVVLLYRLLVALVAPVWISRSSGRRRVWALAIPIGLAFIAQIALREIASIYYSGNADLATLLINLTMVVDSLVVAVGLALAISLYRYALPTISVQEQSSAPLTEVARE